MRKKKKKKACQTDNRCAKMGEEKYLMERQQGRHGGSRDDPHWFNLLGISNDAAELVSTWLGSQG